MTNENNPPSAPVAGLALPLRAVQYDGYIIDIVDSNDDLVAGGFHQRRAAYLVRAANQFPALVECLRDVLGTLVAQFPKEEAERMEVVRNARAALSHAEQVKP